MKGKTTLTRRTQNKEGQSTITSNSTIKGKNNVNSPYKFIIKTTYERGTKEKPEKTHFHKLTQEERKKFSRGLRPSAAQREVDALARMDKKERDAMIEIIDKTNYQNDQNNKIKLRPNKTTLINKNKIIPNQNNRQNFSRGLRPSRAEKEKEELLKRERQYGQKVEIISNVTNRGTKPYINIKGSSQSNTISIVNNNQPNNRRNNRENQDIQLLPNKKVIIRNKQKSLSPLPSPRNTNLPKNYDQNRNLTRRVERTNNILPDENREKRFRNNTVSHSIVEKRGGERKTYVLNERKTDKINFVPNAIRRYNNITFAGNKPERYKDNYNHVIIVSKNISKGRNTYSHDPNLVNTISHKIDATKKEPKKEVVVQPRKLIVIQSVIPSRRHMKTEENKDNTNKVNQNLYIRKYETDKKAPSNLVQKIENIRQYRNYLQQPKNEIQPKYERNNNRNVNVNETRINRKPNNINKNEPQKVLNKTTTYESKYSKPTLSRPQPNQNPTISQYTRIRTDNTKQSIKPDTSKYTSQQKIQPQTYISTYNKRETKAQPQPPKINKYTTTRTRVETNKYTPSYPSYNKDVNQYSRKSKPNQTQTQTNTTNQPINYINRRRENKLDNNDVKQIVYTKTSNTSNNYRNEKPKNYVISNAGFAQNSNNNNFVISKTNQASKPTTINYNVNNENKYKRNIINQDIKPKEIIIKKEIKVEPKEVQAEPEVQNNEAEEVEKEEIQKDEDNEEQKEEINIEDQMGDQGEEQFEEQAEINIEEKEGDQGEEQGEEQNMETFEKVEEHQNENNIENNQQELKENYEEIKNPQLDINKNTEEYQQENIEDNDNQNIEIQEVKDIIINEQKNEQVNEEENHPEQEIEQEQEQDEGEEQVEQNQNNIEMNMYEKENDEENQYEEEAVEGEGEEQFENGEEYDNYEEEGEEEQFENGGEEYDEENNQYEEGNEEGNEEYYEEEVGEEEIQEIGGGDEEEEEVEDERIQNGGAEDEEQ